MDRELLRTAEKYRKQQRKKSIWKKVMGILGGVMVFCVTYALILPAITEGKDVFCGKEEHIHDDNCYALRAESVQSVLSCSYESLAVHVHTPDCYDEAGNILCGQADYVVHTHETGCYDETGNLICAIPERDQHVHVDACYEVQGGHTHSGGCYEEQAGALVCTIPETPGHIHAGDCYSIGELNCEETTEEHEHTDECYEKVLQCEIPESEGHTHSPQCYEPITVLTCTVPEAPGQQVLVCTEPEAQIHVHSEACLQMVTDKSLTCTLAEDEHHRHGPRCYGVWELVCGLEEHRHELTCCSDPNADLETPAEWESTFAQAELTGVWAEDLLTMAESQLGYEESTRNYIVLEDGETMKGYTRYGAWYGSAYGDWCAMFVSFCLNYANIPQTAIPYEASCPRWVAALQDPAVDLFRPAAEYTPVPGDVIFFDWEGDDSSDHVGIVAELIPATGEQPATLKTIEGNSADAVRYVTYELADPQILGYGQLPKYQPPVITLTATIYTDDTYTVTAQDDTVIILSGNLPEDAEVRAFPALVDPSHQALCAYDIAVFLPDGTVFEPATDEQISVSIQTPLLEQRVPEDSQEMAVYYVPEDGQPLLVPSITEDSGVTFDANHFSVYMVRAADAAMVDSQIALKSAIDEGKSVIQLKNDIVVYINDDEGDGYGTVSGPMQIPANSEITLDLNGYTLWQRGSDALFAIPAGSTLTIMDSRAAEETVVKVGNPDSVIANMATSERITVTENNEEKEYNHLTYYVTTSTVVNPATGATMEELEQYTVNTTGGIYANDQTVFRVEGGTLNIQSGMIFGGTGRAIVQTSGITNLSGGYICGFTNGAEGGAVHTTGGDLNISNAAVLAGNKGNRGGAVYTNHTTVNMSGGILSGNTSTYSDGTGEGGTHYGGGGMLLDNSPTIIGGGYITNNVANATGYFDGGGGILACGSMELKIQGGYVTGNRATNGGGIRTNWRSPVTLTMSDGYVCSNLALSAEGGGISLNMDGTGLITGGYINNNTTDTTNHWGGGGLFGATGSTLYIRNVLITENSAGGFGGGVGGCSTGRVYLCVREGGAIYDNSAAGENISGSASSKPEDHVYAANNEVFMSNGYQDYFCALNSIVEGAMLGGYAANWTGSADGAVVRASKNDTLVAAYVMGLNAAPTDQGKDAAVELAKVYMNGNHSNTHGGGILCNGYMIIGETDHIELGARIELSATKNYLGSDSIALAMTEGQFTFEVIDAQTGAVLATASNDETGSINFKERLPFMDAGTFVYYIREVPGNDPTIAFDTTVYRLTVQVRAETSHFDDILVNGDTMVIQRTQYMLDAITIDKRNGDGDWERVSHNDNPSNSDSGAVELSLTSSATFTNVERKKIDINVEKRWDDQTAQLRPDSVTVYLLRNGERYLTATLSASNGWRHSWTGLPVVDEDGTVYSYAVEEAPIPGYVPEYAFVNSSQNQEQKGFWIPADSIQPGKQYIIVSSDCTKVLHQGAGKRNADLGTKDKREITTTTISSGGKTYTAIDDTLIQPASVFVPAHTTQHNNERYVLKNSVDIDGGVSCLLAEDNTNDGIRLKGCDNIGYGSGARYNNGVQLQWQWNAGNSWYDIVYENDRFNAVAADDVNDSNKALLFTHTYVGAITSDTTVRITNHRTDEILFSLDITKRSGINENVLLAGAEFQLLNPQGEALYFVTNSSGAYTLATRDTNGAVSTLVTSSKGKLVLRGLPAGTYTLRETKAPADHEAIDDLPVTLGQPDSNGNISLTLALTIVDNAVSYELPETGGAGTTLYTMGGLLLMAAAGIFLLYNQRKRGKEDMASS